jgi:hypothetical protein
MDTGVIIIFMPQVHIALHLSVGHSVGMSVGQSVDQTMSTQYLENLSLDCYVMWVGVE